MIEWFRGLLQELDFDGAVLLRSELVDSIYRAVSYIYV